MTRPSVAELATLKERGVPILLEGCLEDWPLYRALRSAPALADKLRVLGAHAHDEQISFATIPEELGGHMYFAEGTTTNVRRLQQSGRFADVLARIEGATAERRESVYMHAISVKKLPRLAKAVQVLPYLHDTEVLGSNFWVGSGGHVVDLHFDDYNNFICMLEGHKRLLLAPNEVMHDVYPRPLDRRPYGAPASSVKMLAPDFARFPRLKHALDSFSVAVLAPGDVLYVPPFWWHHVESFGLNVMVNTWQHATPGALADPVADLRRRAMLLYATEPEAVRRAYRARYVRDVFPNEATPGNDDGPRTRTLDRLLERTSAAMAKVPAAHRHAEFVFYDQWIFRTLGDPIENEPGEFDAMMARLRRGRWKKALLRAWFALRARAAPRVRSETGLNT